ncbi:hypothetical protein Leryth_004732 [Lithospermum erythrorhizon]|nr:hypothetical protein Leryth_004732 [Lithospermum erythrorhizon]
MFSIALKSRGFAAVSGRSNMMLMKGGEEGSKAATTTTTSSATTPWVPDPKTGYYRPDNGANEIDPAQLRQMLLNHKIHQN